MNEIIILKIVTKIKLITLCVSKQSYQQSSYLYLVNNY